jgi:hypothetical protein
MDRLFLILNTEEESLMSSIKRELLESISRLDDGKQKQVLEFVRSIAEPLSSKTYSRHELMRLPSEERNRIVAAALTQSLDEDVELFEAYGEADFDDE